MMITEIEYCSRELIFKNIFRTSQTKSSTRRVFYIKLTTENGKHFFGECAPLPQFGSENYPEVENELKRLTGLGGINTPGSEEYIKTLIDNLTSLPTIQYAIEQALFQVFASKNNLPPYLSNKKEININALVDLIEKDAEIESVSKLYDSGYKTVKIKAGRENFEDDLNIISALHQKYGDKINFRLDINGKWSLNEASDNLSRLEGYNIEYIEQPVMDTSELIKLSENIKLPLAADESIRNIEDAKRIINLSRIKYLVLKPMLLGGYFKTSEIAQTAISKGIKVVISSSLESNAGRRHLAAIASTVEGSLAHGLGTSDLFVNDPLPDAFPISQGIINYSPELIEIQNIPFG